VIRYGAGFGNARPRPQGRDAAQYEHWMLKDYEDEAKAVAYREGTLFSLAFRRSAMS
jgi:hypothetical protein